ncbi:hypothetical protein MKW92_013578 [Papaver armeniacum]|nr:hypothetical protein MKW92_013578 [Papaver armeniacum]
MKGIKFLTLLLIILSLYRQSAGAEEDTPVSRFQNYLRFKTAHPNPDYSKPFSYLTSQNLPPSKPLLIITWVGSNPSLPSILLNSHLDSVPAEPSKWIYPPFAATKTEDGKIYARGAQDDKCIAEICSTVQGYSPVRTVHISYVPDEENGGANGAAKFAGSEEFKSLNIGFMGNLIWLKDGLAMNSEVISVNPVYMKAGTPSPTGYQMNMQPSEAEAGFNIRVPPTADPELLIKRILREDGPVKDKMGRPLMTATDDTNPWWGVFKEAIVSAGGTLSKPEILASTTDARYMRKLGIPTFGFSPMTNTPILLHEHNEYLEETVYMRGIKIYESVIRALSSFEGGNHEST